MNNPLAAVGAFVRQHTLAVGIGVLVFFVVGAVYPPSKSFAPFILGMIAGNLALRYIR